MPVIEPPTLRDGDFTLRPGGLDDVDAVTAACQDPEIQRWTGVPSPYRREHAVHWLATGPAGDVVNLLAFVGGRLAGSFGLLEIDRQRGYGEIGYWVAREARRQGVATRAVGLLDDWARAELQLKTIEILPHRDNAPSHRVAERCGFTATGELRRAPDRLQPDDGFYLVHVRKT